MKKYCYYLFLCLLYFSCDNKDSIGIKNISIINAKDQINKIFGFIPHRFDVLLGDENAYLVYLDIGFIVEFLNNGALGSNIELLKTEHNFANRFQFEGFIHKIKYFQDDFYVYLNYGSGIQFWVIDKSGSISKKIIPKLTSSFVGGDFLAFDDYIYFTWLKIEDNIKSFNLYRIEINSENLELIKQYSFPINSNNPIILFENNKSLNVYNQFEDNLDIFDYMGSFVSNDKLELKKHKFIDEPILENGLVPLSNKSIFVEQLLIIGSEYYFTLKNPTNKGLVELFSKNLETGDIIKIDEGSFIKVFPENYILKEYSESDTLKVNPIHP